MSAIHIVLAGRLTVSAICAAAAFGLAERGLEGWGWFIFAAIMLGCVSVYEKADAKEGGRE